MNLTIHPRLEYLFRSIRLLRRQNLFQIVKERWSTFDRNSFAVAVNRKWVVEPGGIEPPTS